MAVMSVEPTDALRAQAYGFALALFVVEMEGCTREIGDALIRESNERFGPDLTCWAVEAVAKTLIG